MQGRKPMIRRGLAATLVGIALGTGAAPALAAEEITALTWSGTWEDGARAVAEAFEQKTGIKVNLELQQSTRFGLARVLAQKDNPQVDILFSTADALQQATDEGVLQTLDAPSMPDFAALPEVARHPTWMDISYVFFGMFYRVDSVPFEPRTIDDLLDPRFENSIASPTAAFASGRWIIYAALTHGGDERNIDPGFEYLSKLRPNIARFFTAGKEGTQLIESGEVSVIAYSIISNFRNLLGNPEYRFVIPDNGPVIANVISAAITSPEHREASMKFLDFLSSAEGQAIYCEHIFCTPTNPDAAAPELLESYRPDPDRLYPGDPKVVNANLPAWDDRFKKEVQVR